VAVNSASVFCAWEDMLQTKMEKKKMRPQVKYFMIIFLAAEVGRLKIDNIPHSVKP
jgi:hypothetical protein